MATKPPPKPAAKGADSSPEAAAPKSKMKLIIIAVIAIVLLAGGGGAWYFLKMRGANDDAAKAQKKAEPPVFVKLDVFTVNLQPEGGEHYLQTNIEIQVANKEDVDLFKVYSPLVKNRILLLLSSKKPSEINNVEGKKKLADEIIASLNQPFTPGGKQQSVSSVLFTSFIIQ